MSPKLEAQIAELCEAAGDYVIASAEVLASIPPRYVRGTEKLLECVRRLEAASAALGEEPQEVVDVH